jgi:hypothetical protein
VNVVRGKKKPLMISQSVGAAVYASSIGKSLMVSGAHDRAPGQNMRSQFPSLVFSPLNHSKKDIRKRGLSIRWVKNAVRDLAASRHQWGYVWHSEIDKTRLKSMVV